jgi:enoyl-CoA hydratase
MSAWTEEREDGIVVFSYGIPAPRSLPIAAMAELDRRFGELARASVPPVVVLAVGIVHADLEEVGQLAAGRPIRDFAPWNEAIAAVETHPLPVIAAIPQRATAGGCELVLACDLRVAAAEAQIGLLETRLGIIPGAGGTQRLSRLVGPGQAARLVYDGGPVDGAEAERIGLVQLLDADPVARARALARRYAQRSAPVLAAAKRSLRAAREIGLADGLRTEGRALLSVLGTPLAGERVAEWHAGRTDLSPS